MEKAETPSKKIIIFDFDGTLADTAPIIRSIYSELALKNKWRTLTDEDYAVLRRGTFRQARKWSGLRWWQLPSLVRSIRRLLVLEAEKVALFPGVADMIRELYKDNHTMYVLSRNFPRTIAQVLKRNNLQTELPILVGRRRYFGSKGAVIKELMRDNNYDKEKVWMVGDEKRDVRAAHKAGVNSVAVAWGIQDVSVLKLYKPTSIARSVKELKEILEA
jgi:phosphoglycolate phosphatase